MFGISLPSTKMEVPRPVPTVIIITVPFFGILLFKLISDNPAASASLIALHSKLNFFKIFF